MQASNTDNQPTIAPRPICVIAREIKKTWKPAVNYAAAPYLDAMGSLVDISEPYGADSGVSVVSYFLANANTWRGDDARRIKRELNNIIAAHRGARR